MGKRTRALREKINISSKTSAGRFYLLTTLLLLFVSLGIIGLAYTKPSFLPKSLSQPLKLGVTYLPGFPKTADQVLIRAFYESKNLQSYSIKTTISLADKTTKLVDLTVVGSLDKNSSTAQISGSFNNSPVEAQTREIGDNFYFNVNKVPTLIGINFGSLSNSWQRIDIKKFQQNLGLTARNDQQIVKDVNNYWSKIDLEKAASRATLMQGGNYYLTKFNIDSKKLEDFLGTQTKLKSGQIAASVQIAKKTYHITKIELNGQLTQPEEEKITIVYEIKKINNDQKISSPSEFQALSGPADLTLRLNGEQFSTQKIGETGSNFLTIERLIKVLLLLPKSL